MYQGDLDKFILFFAGKGSKRTMEEKIDTGCNLLFSQINERSHIKRIVKYLREHPEAENKLFVDSGAYSAFTQGKEIDIDEYIDFINDIGDVVFVFAELDFIGTGSAETEHMASEKSWENYLYMIDRVKPEYRDKIMPVFHANESFDCLRRMLEYQFDDGEHIKYVGLGALTEASGADRLEWLKICFQIIQNSSNPNVMTHAFGCTDLTVLENVPLTSADSTSAVILAAYGRILHDRKSYIVSSVSAHKKDYYKNYLSKKAQEQLAEEVKKFGFELSELEETSGARELYNVRYMRDWELHYKYKGDNKVKVQLF